MEELRERCLELALRTFSGFAAPAAVIHAAEQYVQFINGPTSPAQTDSEKAALKSLGFV
jgi:hypothetical protein